MISGSFFSGPILCLEAAFLWFNISFPCLPSMSEHHACISKSLHMLDVENVRSPIDFSKENAIAEDILENL